MSTVVPPFEQSVGAFVCGPYTVKVIVPVGPEPPVRDAEIDGAVIWVPAVPVAGALAVRLGLAALTVVAGIPLSQVLVDARLSLSPL